MIKKYQVTVEFSVNGFSSGIITYTKNSIEKIKEKINQDIDKFVKDINDAQERDGDQGILSTKC